MALQTNHKWMIAIVGIIILAVIAYFIYQSIPKSGPPVNGTPGSTTTNPGILTTLQAAYCKIFPNSKLCGGQGSGGGVDPCDSVQCDPDRDGWDMDGFPNNCCS